MLKAHPFVAIWIISIALAYMCSRVIARFTKSRYDLSKAFLDNNVIQVHRFVKGTSAHVAIFKNKTLLNYNGRVFVDRPSKVCTENGLAGFVMLPRPGLYTGYKTRHLSAGKEILENLGRLGTQESGVNIINSQEVDVQKDADRLKKDTFSDELKSYDRKNSQIIYVQKDADRLKKETIENNVKFEYRKYNDMPENVCVPQVIKYLIDSAVCEGSHRHPIVVRLLPETGVLLIDILNTLLIQGLFVLD